MKKQKGFTLIEILIMFGIALVLIAISYTNIKKSSKSSDAAKSVIEEEYNKAVSED